MKLLPPGMKKAFKKIELVHFTKKMNIYIDINLSLFHSRLTNGHVNFAKARLLSKKLKEFSIWKDVECPYGKTPAVAEFLQFSPIWKEKGTNFFHN